MQSLLWALGTLLLLLPIVYFLPIGLTIRGKVVIIFSAFFLALLGILAHESFPMWQTTLMLVLLAVITTYFFNNRLNGLLFPIVEPTMDDDSNYELQYFETAMHNERIDQEEFSEPKIESIDLLDEFENGIAEEKEFDQVHVNQEEESETGNDGNLTSFIIDHSEVADITPLSFLEYIKEEKMNLAKENEKFTENQLDNLSELEKLVEGELDNPQEFANHTNHEIVEETKGTLETEKSLDFEQDRIDSEGNQQKITEGTWLDQLEVLEDFSFVSNEVVPTVSIGNNEPVITTVTEDEMEMNEELFEHKESSTELDVQEEIPAILDNSSESSLMNEEHEETEVEIDEIPVLHVSTPSEPVESSDNSILEDEKIDPTKQVSGSLQHQIFTTIVAQVNAEGKKMDLGQFERVIKKNLHSNLPVHDYYTFASLLIERYILEKQFENLGNFLEEVKEKVSNYHILKMELDYLSDKYCKKSL